MGNNTVSGQIIIRSPQGSYNIVQLVYNTSLFDLKTSIAKRASIWLKPVQFAGSID